MARNQTDGSQGTAPDLPHAYPVGSHQKDPVAGKKQAAILKYRLAFLKGLGYDFSGTHEKSERLTSRDMTTTTSRPVSMISRNFTINPMIDARPRW